MTIGSIGTNAYSMGQMSGMDRRPNPSEMFGKMDEDDSGGLDQVEFSELAQKISEATGEDIDVEELYAAYDEDGDGELSETETQAVMDDYRPAGPPPQGPPPGGGPDPSAMFSDADADGDGVLDTEEAEGLAEMISSATGETVSADDLIAEYDEDGDGGLSEAETLAALDANRPEGPPPPPEMAENEETDSVSDTSSEMSVAIENYLKNAVMGSGSSQASLMSTLFGSDNASSSAAALFTVNTHA